MNRIMEKYFTEHWQVILGGLLYFTGSDLLGADQSGLWILQIAHWGKWAMDISMSVIGFRAVSETTKKIDNLEEKKV